MPFESECIIETFKIIIKNVWSLSIDGMEGYAGECGQRIFTSEQIRRWYVK